MFALDVLLYTLYFTSSLCLIWIIYQFLRNLNYFYLYCICITLFIHIFSLSTNLTSNISVKLLTELNENFNILFVSNAMHNNFSFAPLGAEGPTGIMRVQGMLLLLKTK